MPSYNKHGKVYYSHKGDDHKKSTRHEHTYDTCGTCYKKKDDYDHGYGHDGHDGHDGHEEKSCPKGYGSLKDYKKKDDCDDCDEKCCANPCIDVQKNVVAITKCVKRIDIDGTAGPVIEFDVVNAVYEIVLTNKTCETFKKVQIQDSLAAIDGLLGVGTDVNFNVRVQSCDDHLKVKDNVADIFSSGGNLLDECKSSIPPCTSCRILLKFRFSLVDVSNVDFTINTTDIEFESSCTLSKVTNSLTVTGCIEPKCKDKCGYHLKKYDYGHGYGNVKCGCDDCNKGKHDHGHGHGKGYGYDCKPHCELACCKKSKCKEICPIVVQAESILDSEMELGRRMVYED
jgi:hypothetical protein